MWKPILSLLNADVTLLSRELNIVIIIVIIVIVVITVTVIIIIIMIVIVHFRRSRNMAKISTLAVVSVGTVSWK